MTPSRIDRRAGLTLRLQVLRAQAGDESAFAALLNDHGPATRRYLGQMVEQDVDDLQQELWLTVYRRIGELADPGAFRTWLFRIARHRAIDRLRRLRRERELFVDLDTEPVDVAADIDDQWPAEDLERALGALAPIHREVALLRHRDGLGYGEIALILGVPIGTVRSRLHHAHHRLREILRPATPSPSKESSDV